MSSLAFKEIELEAVPFCSICVTSINNFTQKYFMGNVISPVCKDCDDIDTEETDVF